MKKLSLLSVLLGTIFSFSLLFLVAVMCFLSYCAQKDRDVIRTKTLNECFNDLPQKMYYIILGSCITGAFLGGIIPSVMTENVFNLSAIVGILLVLIMIFIFLTFPFPFWFEISSITVCLPFAMLGRKIVSLVKVKPSGCYNNDS